GFWYARQVATKRGGDNLVYRMFAVAGSEHYSAAYPREAEPRKWLLGPKPRHILLSELGRLGRPASDDNGTLRYRAPDVSRLFRLALAATELRPEANGVSPLFARSASAGLTLGAGHLGRSRDRSRAGTEGMTPHCMYAGPVEAVTGPFRS